MADIVVANVTTASKTNDGMPNPIFHATTKPNTWACLSISSFIVSVDFFCTSYTCNHWRRQTWEQSPCITVQPVHQQVLRRYAKQLDVVHHPDSWPVSLPPAYIQEILPYVVLQSQKPRMLLSETTCRFLIKLRKVFLNGPLVMIFTMTYWKTWLEHKISIFPYFTLDMLLQDDALTRCCPR
jgi:hypothetical protein